MAWYNWKLQKKNVWPKCTQVVGICIQLNYHLSNETNPGCLGYIGDYTTQYVGILISQYKDPYKPTSIMESSKGFFRGSFDVVS